MLYYCYYETYVGQGLVQDWLDRENFVRLTQTIRQLSYSLFKKNQEMTQVKGQHQLSLQFLILNERCE